MVTPKTAPPRTTYRVSEVADTLGLSRNKVYRMVYAGELSAVKVSSRPVTGRYWSRKNRWTRG